MTNMATICGFVLCAFLGLLAATIIVWIWQGKIDLTALLSEANGDASMSRFQLLIFTFVIAISLFSLVERTTPPGYPAIPTGILTLLGISASTYAVGKGISYSQPSIMMGTPIPNGDSEGNATDAQAAADEAASHAAAAQQAAADIKASVSQMAVHAATAQQAVQQTAENAAKALWTVLDGVEARRMKRVAA